MVTESLPWLQVCLVCLGMTQSNLNQRLDKNAGSQILDIRSTVIGSVYINRRSSQCNVSRKSDIYARQMEIRILNEKCLSDALFVAA